MANNQPSSDFAETDIPNVSLDLGVLPYQYEPLRQNRELNPRTSSESENDISSDEYLGSTHCLRNLDW